MLVDVLQAIVITGGALVGGMILGTVIKGVRTQRTQSNRR